MIAGVIPAAGHSRRMGRPKLALPVAGKTVLEHVITALHAAEVNPVLVVLGPHVAELSDKAREAGAEVLLLPWPTADMRATIERGLEWLEERVGPGAEDGWLLVPGDHPTLQAGIVREVIQGWESRGECSIVVPTWQGKRGHPTLIGWGHVAGLRAHPAAEGLNSYLRGQAAVTRQLAVESASVVEDLDTPEDYARLLTTRS